MLVFSRFFTGAGAVAVVGELWELEHPAAVSANATAKITDNGRALRNFNSISGSSMSVN
jgi:hypothetical protein